MAHFCLSVAVGEGVGHGKVPSVLVLSGSAGSLSGIHGPLLYLSQVHQTKVQSGLVKSS